MRNAARQIVLGIVAVAATAHASFDTMTYQGVLLDDDGVPLPDGPYRIQFVLFDVPTDGMGVWFEEHLDIPVAGGIFTAQLGVSTPFGTVFDDHADLFLEIRAFLPGGFETFSPRVPLTAAPYAFSASDSARLEGFSLDDILGLFRGSGIISTISGGSTNSATGHGATVGGGQFNEAIGPFSTIAGGGGISTIFGNNRAFDQGNSIGGGHENETGTLIGNAQDGRYATVGGGFSNTAAGPFSTIPGGASNLASGDYSFSGGFDCSAQGDFSMALGRGSVVTGNGSFYWHDSTLGGVSLGFTNVFGALSTGGVLFRTSSDGLSGVILPGGSGTWTSLSDRNRKKDFEAVDPAEVLEKVAGMPIEKWSYTTEDGVRHLGPTSQDFHAAFGLGVDDKGIATLDGNGVALAAIQGLHAENEALKARIAQLETLVEKLVKDNDGR